jgi:hypothetical protein
MKTYLQKFCVIIALLALPLFINGQMVSPHPDRGLGLIWYGDQSNLTSRNGTVTIGQVFFVWRFFEPTEGNYDFAKLDSELQNIQNKGMKATIQVNGNRHPDYLFDLVPYLNGVQLPSSRDHLDGFGPPMYWHNVYKQKYENMMVAIANHLKNSPYKDAVLAIRHSNNAVGTEHFSIPPEYRDQPAWTKKSTATWGGPWPWTGAVADDYKEWALNMYIDAFNPPTDFNLFIRAGAIKENTINSQQLNMVENGDLWIFETSSEPQPRNLGKNDQYQVFVDYCKSGKTYGLMESWSSANTNSSGWDWSKTNHPITEHQFNYWTLLSDLHSGATFPAMRPEDMDAFPEDYVFTAKYAGNIAHPNITPGAWIAFREGDWLVGDYTFLMERDPADNSPALYNVDAEKQGLWARSVPTSDPMEINMNSTFASSLSGNTDVKIRLWYKDVGTGSFQIDAFGQSHSFSSGGTNDWKLAEKTVTVSNTTPDVQISASGNNLTVHMFEVLRGTPTTDSQSPFKSHSIPGVIEAEDYDTGANGIAYNDFTSGNTGGDYRTDDVDVNSKSASNGHVVSWIENGEWLEYTIENLSSGNYDIELAYSSGASSQGDIQISIDGNTIGTFTNIPATADWNTFDTLLLSNVSVNGASNAVLRIEFINGAGFDIDNITFNSTGGATHTITASAGSNGSISPSGNVNVTEGEDQVFTITPDQGYDVADVLVNGSSVGAVSSYTFTNVTANHTIDASFTQQSSGTTYSEDFNDGSAQNWIEVSGTWSVSGNEYNNSTNGGNELAVYDGDTFSDYTYTASVKPDWGNLYGVVFNYQDNNNYYLLSLDASPKDIELIKVQSGNSTTLATSTYTGGGEDVYSTIEVTNDGSYTSVQVNGSPVFTDVATTTFSSGKIGLYSNFNPIYADDIEVIAGGQTTTSTITASAGANDVVIYPNPVTNTLNITHISKTDRVEIMDLSGKIILTDASSDASTTEVDVSNLKKGVYLLKLTGSKNNKVIQFIKY